MSQHALMRKTGTICVWILTVSLAVAQGEATPQGPRIMRTGTFHGNEVVARSGEQWLALVAADGGWTLAEACVQVDPVRDALQDADGAATGKRVSVAPDGPVLVLIRGVGGLRPGPVATAAARPVPLAIGRSVTLQLGDRRYRLAVTCGTAAPVSADNFRECPLELAEGARSQRLLNFSVYHPPGGRPVVASDAQPTLLWAGDLDRDGALDLLLDITNHYNMSHAALFLSSAAPNGDLVAKVAEFVTYGD